MGRLKRSLSIQVSLGCTIIVFFVASFDLSGVLSVSVPEKQLVARVLFHFIVRSKLSHRILGSVSGERALQAPYFSIAKLRDMARLSNAEMEVWARSCRDPSSDKADPDVSADQKARVEESVRAINNVLRRSWRMDSYSECKPHTSVPMPLYRSALMEAADGTVSGKPGFGVVDWGPMSRPLFMDSDAGMIGSGGM